MNHKSKEGKPISRRGVLPLLGAGLFLPIFGANAAPAKNSTNSSDGEYQLLLKKDGTTVKVSNSALHSATVVKRNTSTKSLLNWISKKL